MTQKKKSSGIPNIKIFYLILVAVCAIVYYNCVNNDFVFDDDSVILSDNTLKDISNIPKYFTGHEGFHKVIGRYYRPTVSTTYNIDYAIWNLRPAGFHITNILIHIINVLLCFKLLCLMFSGEDKKNLITNYYAPFIGALIFAVQPIHTEAVAWVSGRTDSLSFTFFAAAFIYYLKYENDESVKSLILLCIFYFAALLSKEMAITLPAIIILYDIIVKKRNISYFKENYIRYLFLISVSVLYLVIRWLTLKDIPDRETYNYFYSKDFWTVLLTMLQTIPVYLKLSLIPIGMLYHYTGYMPYVSSVTEPKVLLSIFIIIGLLILAAGLRKKIPMISFAILFFFVTLTPVMNIIPTMNFMADRFLYVPSLAVSIIVSSLFLLYYRDKYREALIVTLALIIVAYGYMTVKRNAEWKDNNTLFLTAEGKPGVTLYVNIGNIYANNREIDIAAEYYKKALELKTESVLANVNLGKVYMIKDIYDSAYYYLNRAYEFDTLSPEPMFALAQLYARMKKIPEAVYYLEKIQKETPNYMNSSVMLEQFKSQLKEQDVTFPQGSLQDMTKIAEIEKQAFQFYQEKKYQEAVKNLLDLVQMNPPGAAGYYNNTGMCFLEQGNLDEAEKYFKLASESDSKFSVVYNNLGTVYEKKGDKVKAREFYQKALEIDPNNQDAKHNLNNLK